MKIIGLTGGIGSGKSTVAQYFKALGAPVIDADVIAHELVNKNSPALKAIQQAFGDSILNTDGSLNRAKMRSLVFDADNLEYKNILESILHPLIYTEIQSQIKNLSKIITPKPAYCIVVIPLLIEKWDFFKNIIDIIIVIDTPIELQLNRILKRDINKNLSKEQALAIINNQASREERLDKADHIIFNTENLEELKNQVSALHNLWA